MPPPSFSTQTISQLNVPRGVLSLLKDVKQQAEALLRTPSPGQLEACQAAIQALLADPQIGVEVAEDNWLLHFDGDMERSQVCRTVGERLSSELLDVYYQAKAPPEQLRPSLLHMLEALVLCIGAQKMIRDWWDVLIVPSLASPALGEADVARAVRLTVFLMMDVAPSEYDPGEESVRVPSPAWQFTQSVLDMYIQSAYLLEIASEKDDDEDEDVPETTALLAQPSLTRSLAAALSLFGSLRPLRFLHHLDEAFDNLSAQSTILSLLMQFLHAHSMHAYQIMSTHLLDKLVSTLEITESTRVLAQGVTCLLMIVPHIPMYLVRDGGVGVANMFRVYARAISTPVTEIESHTVPSAHLLFTLLYGLFPLHFLAFIRAPAATLEDLGDTRLWDDLVNPTVQSRSLSLFRCHLVHPNLATHERAAELNPKTWQSSEASDRLAQCMSLFVPQPDGPGLDAPSPMLATSTTGDAAVSDVSMLRNELRFELYLKEQLLIHIGRLHRDRITDAANEAEQQNLQHTSRALQSQLAALQARLERQRSEVQATSGRHVQWERELNAKLSTYRDERRQRTMLVQQLTRDLEQSQRTVAQQAERISQMGERLFNLESELQLAAPRLERLHEYDATVRQLGRRLTEWEDGMVMMQAQRDEMDKLLMQWENMQLAVTNSERSAREHSDAADQRAEDVARLQAELDKVRALAERLRTRVEQPEPVAPRAPAPSDHAEVEALRARNTQLEMEMLNLRATLDLQRANGMQHDPRTEWGVPAPHEVALFSPNTLAARDPACDDDAVPPLSLDG
ncbi:hypothetical protein MCAP1_000790 [Malassezia caprae]|uniref:Hamartin n=1 Tax=Malassezia caprae TaxID=1381934 RepID=A0AAF0E8A4_9BASI|nr:hypothetical protein MCAP1_000790 [Malassezia caprae]